MSDMEDGKGLGLGCVIAAVIGAVLIVVIVAAGVGALFFFRVSAAEAPVAPRPVPRVTIHEGPAAGDVSPATDIGPHESVTVILTDTGDGGTCYMIDYQKTHEGEEALKRAISELVAEARKSGKKLIVNIKVMPDPGGVVAGNARDTAASTCRSAGAVVMGKQPEAKK